MSKLHHSLVLSCSLTLAVSFACADEREARHDDPFVPAAHTTWRARYEQVKRELSGLKDHPWAGTYRVGSRGRGPALLVAPESGFVSKTESHGSWESDLNFGDVTFSKDGTLLPRYTFPPVFWLSSELVPVRWAGRRFLVPVKIIPAFCMAINSGHEPGRHLSGGRDEFVFVREDDRSKRLSGVEKRPDLPERFRGFLLAKPIEATVVSVGESAFKWRECAKELTLNVGQVDGVVEGMIFRLSDPPNVTCHCSTVRSLTAIHVRRQTTDILVGQCSKDDSQWCEFAEPSIGWKLTTALPDKCWCKRDPWDTSQEAE